MSTFGSSQLTMSTLLLRRNASVPIEDVDHDTITLLSDYELMLTSRGRSDSVPFVSQELLPLPTPSHKRKQSDTVDFSEMRQLSPPDFRSSLNLEKIEQGGDNEEDDETIVFTAVSGGRYSDHHGRLFFSYPVSNARLIITVVFLTALMTLHFSRGRARMESTGHEERGNMEVIGDPIEASIPKYNWIEFYNDPKRVGPIVSSGPIRVDHHDGGLYLYDNVCLTNNVDAPKAPTFDTSMRGLIYFTNELAMANNPKRCVPCETGEIDDRWIDNSKTSVSVGHQCGMKGLHTMYASSIDDWNMCMRNDENHAMIVRHKQNQSPSYAKKVHFFEKPTFLLQFQAHDRNKSLFDTLFTYLPHWYKYKTNGDFPFQSVISHSVEGCLSHSRNWFCEIIHHMNAFGDAKEIIWEQTESTLYCFKNLYYNQLSYQQKLDHDGLITKSIMNDFRDELYHSFALPRPRDMREIRKKDAKLGMTRPFKIALYGNENQKDNVWKGLEKLIVTSRSMNKFHAVEFIFIENFRDFSVAEQARVFNLADAIISATGDHMANAIFATDDTTFVELGCNSFSSISNLHFMTLISGTYRRVENCSDDHNGDDICVLCSIGQEETSFSVTSSAFYALIDELVKSHQEKIAFMRDSR